MSRQLRLSLIALCCSWSVCLILPRAAAAEDAAPGQCVPRPNVLCLHDNRFEVSASWRTKDDRTGLGLGVQLTQETGYFWFFDSGNIEVVVKVLDGCTQYNRFWVFSSGMTNVEVMLLVTDTLTRETKLYINPLGQTYVTTSDTNAFACE